MSANTACRGSGHIRLCLYIAAEVLSRSAATPFSDVLFRLQSHAVAMIAQQHRGGGKIYSGKRAFTDGILGGQLSEKDHKNPGQCLRTPPVPYGRTDPVRTVRRTAPGDSVRS